jgi:hypothetical protein
LFFHLGSGLSVVVVGGAGETPLVADSSAACCVLHHSILPSKQSCVG